MNIGKLSLSAVRTEWWHGQHNMKIDVILNPMLREQQWLFQGIHDPTVVTTKN